MMLKTLRLSDPDAVVSYRAQGSGAPVVLIHGVGMQSAAFMPQIEALGRTNRVFAVDMPGHGGSDGLAKGSLLPAFVAWFHRVVVGLGLERFSLVGHSMGALIAVGYAHQHAENLSRVALLNGVFCRDRAARTAVEARAALIRSGKVDLQAPLDRWFDSAPGEIAARDKVSAWLRSVDPAGYATAYTAFALGDATYADRFSHIACPFLALTGDKDQNSTPAMSQEMAALVQDGHAVVIKGHRHMVSLTAAEEVNAHLRDWLARHPASERELQ